MLVAMFGQPAELGGCGGIFKNVETLSLCA